MIYQGLSKLKRRLCKEYVGKKVTTRRRLICVEIFAFTPTWARDLIEKLAARQC